MAAVINTNAMSLNAQRNLTASGNSLATSIQRLSSGLRINSAKDDAAGLAISERFTTQIRGLDVATRNANDGISLTQTAEGAMVEIGNNLQRIRELAVQSANATNDQTDRDALQAEVDQLLSEIDRVAKQTNFNGTKLLDGSFGGNLFQIGADAGQTIAIDGIIDANTASLGGVDFASGTLTTAVTTGKGVAITGMKITGTDGKEVTLGDITVAAGKDDDETQANTAKAIAAEVNKHLDQTGVLATVDGADVKFDSIRADTDGKVAVAGGTWKDSDGGSITAPTVTVATARSFAGDIDIGSVAGAQQAMSLADKALEVVNNSRAQMGAIQNRFSSTVANLSATSENLAASRSRIRDTDYAKETAELTRTQILQQAGTAMLAQANSAPQSVLSLLG